MSDTKPAPWTGEDEGKLRRMLAANSTGAEIAAALGRTESAISSRIHTLGLAAFKRLPAATEARIRDLLREGYQPSRIARRLQVPVEVVERYAA